MIYDKSLQKAFSFLLESRDEKAFCLTVYGLSHSAYNYHDHHALGWTVSLVENDSDNRSYLSSQGTINVLSENDRRDIDEMHLQVGFVAIFEHFSLAWPARAGRCRVFLRPNIVYVRPPAGTANC